MAKIKQLIKEFYNWMRENKSKLFVITLIIIIILRVFPDYFSKTVKNMDFLFKPEYIALIISVIAIVMSVYIAYKNRKYAFLKEEYFKLQQMVEKIISKLLILEKHRQKLKIFFELIFKVDKNKDTEFIDTNETFNRKDFDKEGEQITAFIDIYFPSVGDDWNYCLDKMSGLFTHIFILNEHIESSHVINWELEAKKFNKLSLELGERPREIADKLKDKLKEYKRKNL